MIRDALRRVPERTLTPAPHAQPHRRTPGSSPPTRKAARRSLRCVDAERESRGLPFNSFGNPRLSPPAFFSTTAIFDPSNTASSSNVDRSRRRDARKEAHTRSARSATRPERTSRDAARKDFTRKKRKRQPNSTKKRRSARGAARLRARRKPPSIKETEQRKKRRAARQTVNPFPSVLLPSRGVCKHVCKRVFSYDRNSKP